MYTVGENFGPVGCGAFRTTHWSVILSARESDPVAAQQALAELYQQYRYPLYAYIRRKGYNHHEAQDLTQDFFAQLITRNSLDSVSRDKGHFRTFLLACADNCLGSHRQKAAAAKRGGEYAFLSWDDDVADESYRLEVCDTLSPEKAFDRRWALTVLEAALNKLKQEYARACESARFDVLQAFLSGEKRATSYAEAAAELKTSEAAVRVAVHRLRQRYGKLVRAEIRHTVSSPEEVPDELRYLRSILAA